MHSPFQAARRGIAVATLVLAGFAISTGVQAQGLADAFLEEIIVTATKREGGIDVQDAGLAISAYGENQIDAMHLRDLSALGFVAPSVQLEDIGTTRGTANFTVRGVGINSSIPSIDPAVGVFVDGMYLGINSGVVLDMFDVSAIEVLRGPQGLLFGRNVTGGAVLIHTTRPADEFSINAKVAAETGLNQFYSAVVSGPLSEASGGKLAVYHNSDDGWHRNLLTGQEHGAADTTLVRGAYEFAPGGNWDAILRYEHGESDGDGPASQNAGLFSEESFDFSIDEPGFYDAEWDQAILEASVDVEFGDGEIVNILGYRQYSNHTLGDIDASPLFIFHALSTTDHTQWTNELRYSGSFDNVYLTTGIFYMQQDLAYFEQRLIPPAGLDITGGGFQDMNSVGVFTQADIGLTDEITLNLGARYDREEKDAEIAALPLNMCLLGVGCSNFDLVDTRTWNAFTPKIGLQVHPDETTQMYAFWTRGYRSGGYNMRHTAVLIPNQSFDQEELTSMEVGLKKDFAEGRLRLNAAAYYNTFDDMQREVNLSDPVVGVVQIIRNTADATITGFDMEFSAALTDSLFLQTSLGYVDGSYDEVLFDISGDGEVNAVDENLEIPRLAPWSYGAQLTYQAELPMGTLTIQGSGYHRDDSFYTDNNAGRLRGADMFNVNVSVGFMDDQLIVSAFGKNLKDEVTIGGDTQLPPNFPGGPLFPVPTLAGDGATFSPLNKGRVWGAEVQYRFE
ncbi:MAG TPA: TonB-dependent receptor [Woeseiaceae bacterium]|nr:TonB-dependent receptor [Woeseiaceae bacterium]